MPETRENETSALKKAKRNERTEARFFEDVRKLTTEAQRLDTEYNPPNAIAELAHLTAKLSAALTALNAHRSDNAELETARNHRENLYKTLNSDVSSLINYAFSAGRAANEIAALRTIARRIKGTRAVAIDPNRTADTISVSHLSYASRADNYAQFIEQYESLNIETDEEMYKVSHHRARLKALQDANHNVITKEAAANASGITLDRLAYLDADSLMNSCISGKRYIFSKYKRNGAPYQNIAKTRFVLPSRLRK